MTTNQPQSRRSLKRRVLLNLTRLEARMLSLVVGNGWGDGDFAEWLGNGRDAAACRRAMDKLDAAIGQSLNATRSATEAPHE